MKNAVELPFFKLLKNLVYLGGAFGLSVFLTGIISVFFVMPFAYGRFSDAMGCAAVFLFFFIWGFVFRSHNWDSKYFVIFTSGVLFLLLPVIYPLPQVHPVLALSFPLGWLFKAIVTYNETRAPIWHLVLGWLVILPMLFIFVTETAPLYLYNNSPFSRKNVYFSSQKQAVSDISTAYVRYRQEHEVSSLTTAKDLIPYMSYVGIDTSTHYKAAQINKGSKLYKGERLQPCSNKLPCLKLHNGAILQYDPKEPFTKYSSGCTFFMNLDPDGNGEHGRVSFFLYSDGRIRTGGNVGCQNCLSENGLETQGRNPNYIYRSELTEHIKSINKQARIKQP